MYPAAATMDNDNPSPAPPSSLDAGIMRRDASPSSWEPYVVWLTRIKLPRDLAELRRAENPHARAQ